MIKCTNERCIYNNNKENGCYLKNNNISKGLCTSFTSEKIFDKLAELYKKDVENNIKNANYYSVKNSISCDNDFCIYNKKMQCVLNNIVKMQDGNCVNFTRENFLDSIIET